MDPKLDAKRNPKRDENPAVFSKIGSIIFIILLVGLSLDASFIRFCFLLVVLIRLFLFFVVASSSLGC